LPSSLIVPGYLNDIVLIHQRQDCFCLRFGQDQQRAVNVDWRIESSLQKRTNLNAVLPWDRRAVGSPRIIETSCHANKRRTCAAGISQSLRNAKRIDNVVIIDVHGQGVEYQRGVAWRVGLGRLPVGVL
jgi:hypothetical protein